MISASGFWSASLLTSMVMTWRKNPTRKWESSLGAFRPRCPTQFGLRAAPSPIFRKSWFVLQRGSVEHLAERQEGHDESTSTDPHFLCGRKPTYSIQSDTVVSHGSGFVLHRCCWCRQPRGMVHMTPVFMPHWMIGVTTRRNEDQHITRGMSIVRRSKYCEEKRVSRGGAWM